ncbi:MAG: hypothetical protein R2860_03815 [Desulfobacterales bacterium]
MKPSSPHPVSASPEGPLPIQSELSAKTLEEAMPLTYSRRP